MSLERAKFHCLECYISREAADKSKIVADSTETGETPSFQDVPHLRERAFDQRCFAIQALEAQMQLSVTALTNLILTNNPDTPRYLFKQEVAEDCLRLCVSCAYNSSEIADHLETLLL